MLAKLVALALLALAVVDLALADITPEAPTPHRRIHTTIAARLSGVELHNGPYYYVRDGICSGVLNTTYLCGNDVIEGLEVKVTDKLGFAEVDISNNLDSVIITRAYNSVPISCPGRALVDLKLSCLQYKPSYSHSRIVLPNLLMSNTNGN